MSSHPEPPPAELFAAAIRDPLPTRMHGSAVRLWLDELQNQFSMLCFRPYAYYNLQDTNLTTTFPLQRIIDSILEDDGLSTDPPEPVEPPLATVDRRRGWLAGTARTGASLDERAEWSFDDGEPSELRPSDGPHLTVAPELFQPGSESLYHYDPPHHEAEWVGRRLSELVDARETARAAGDNEALEDAEVELERFLHDLGVLTYGRPREGPAPRVLESLYEEIHLLFELCWEVCPVELSDATQGILQDLEIPDDPRRIWGILLALPVLSLLEVRVLTQEIHAASEWGDRPHRPTPRRTALAVLSHRLGMDQSSIARRIWDSGGAVEEFQRPRDPFAELTG